jgi:hypothetical protein
VLWVDHPWPCREWCRRAMRCGGVQGGKDRAPCLADLSQLSNSAALLGKISTTEQTSLATSSGSGYIPTSKLLICAG